MTNPAPELGDQRFAVIDIETSGLEPSSNKILQIAVVTCDAKGTVLDEWSTYVKPPHWPLARVGPRTVHGITRRTLKGAPDAATALRELAAHLAGTVVTAHNAQFDLGFVRHHAARCGVELPETPVVCTLTVSRSLDSEARASHRLADVCRRYGVPLERAHDALADARATAGILPHLIEAAGISSMSELLERAAPSTERRRPTRRDQPAE